MGELKKLQWAAWKEKKTPAIMHGILHTEGFGFSGAGCLLLLLLPGSWVPGRRVSRKLVKTTMSEKEKQSLYVKTAVFTYLLQFQFHRFKETAWLSSPGEELFNGTWRLKHQLSWILYTQLTLTQYWISRNSKTFKTYSFVFELSSDIDIIINKELCVT